MANGKVVRNKMSQAFENALSKSIERGINPGKIGAQILRNRHRGVGVVWRERLTLKKKEKNYTAESAESLFKGHDAFQKAIHKEGRMAA